MQRTSCAFCYRRMDLNGALSNPFEKKRKCLLRGLAKLQLVLLKRATEAPRPASTPSRDAVSGAHQVTVTPGKLGPESSAITDCLFSVTTSANGDIDSPCRSRHVERR